MVKLTEYELKLIAKNRGINNYLSTSREKLISTLDTLERITENLSKYGLNKIAKMQNLALDELEQIKQMNNFSENKLKQITKAQYIKKYKNMSKEDLIIALLKSNQSYTELRKSENNNTEIQKTKKLFNKLRNNFSKEEINKIRKKFHIKENNNKYLKKLEKKDSLTEQEEKNIMILQKPKKYFEKLKEDLNKLKRYQFNIIDNIGYKGLKEIEYLFNKISEDDYYEPIETSADFDGKYIAYECRGDRDNNLSLEEYLNIIRPYLRDMINNHKAISEWKIKLIMRISFVSSLDSKKIHTIHTKSDSTEIMSGIETNDIINELFKSFSKRYQEKLETKMKGSNFVFESVD